MSGSILVPKGHVMPVFVPNFFPSTSWFYSWLQYAHTSVLRPFGISVRLKHRP